MNFLKFIENWLDIRPGETRKVILCALGAFLLLSFVVLARSIREGLFLELFNVKNSPYITAGVACLSLPAVGLFAGLLGRFHPWTILRGISLLFYVGLAALWIVSDSIRVVAVVFYLWTAIGALLLTSGFWVLIAESFAVRGAKRLFGLIAAGGTAGAMAMGLSMKWISHKFHFVQLLPLLIAILLLLYLVEYCMYRLLPAAGKEGRRGIDSRKKISGDENRSEAPFFHNIKNNLGMILESPYLKSMAAMVFVATVASNIVGYQFWEFAQINISGEALTGFFGAFYGYAGGIALAVQLLFTSRIISSAGVKLGLAILPLFLLLGSTGFLFVPALIFAILVRGGDYTLRQSLLRPVLEFLYVPIPAPVRRKTKMFIDSFISSAGEGMGAVVIIIGVVLIGVQSRYLSILVILLSLFMLYLSRRMGRQYMNTIVGRLEESDTGMDHARQSAGLRSQTSGSSMDLLAASYSKLDLQSVLIDFKALSRTGLEMPQDSPAKHDYGKRDFRVKSVRIDSTDINGLLQSSDNERIKKVLKKNNRWDPEQIRLMIRLLARDSIHKAAAQALARTGNITVPELSVVLKDEAADFVIRRRIPRILAGIGGATAEKALLDALFAGRFEIRYRAVIGLVKLKKKGLHVPSGQVEPVVWDAIRNEIRCDRPVWEMRRLLDSPNANEEDVLITQRVDTRSNLSLEHTFRMLTLVLDSKPVSAALHGILSQNDDFKSFALEYLEHILPTDIKNGLWAFIGDESEARKRKQTRPLQRVVSDLMSSRATLFYDGTGRNVLERMLKKRRK